ncbi:radical SAM protein [Allorhizobium pseudoryzae]|uniref:radical SAM protein n=1 Tax=Allorhizobium pseudoryzae TaxID=379684 RepID=UPI003CFBD924
MTDLPNEEVSRQSRDAWNRTAAAMRSARAEKHPGLVYPIEVTLKCEPRIAYLKELIEQALKLGHFTVGGERVEIDGFKIRDIEDWTTQLPPSAEEIFDLLSTRCAVQCEFCYLRMDTGNTVAKFNINRKSDIEKDVELRLLLAETGRRLFAPTFQLEEVLSHPLFFHAAERMRKISDQPFYLSTTGNALDERTIDRLEAVAPVEIRVSLNSSSPDVRARIMQDKSSTVLRSLGIMSSKHMRFSVSLVAWPAMAWSEIEETIRFADKSRPYAIFVILPGFTRTFSPQMVIDSDVYYREVAERIVALRYSVRTPLILHPRLFEQIALGYPPNTNLVIGVTPDSPAANATIRIGDIITGMDDFANIVSQRQLSNLLSLRHRSLKPFVSIHLLRDGEPMRFELDVHGAYRAGYPNKPPFEDHFGINLLSQGIAISDLREISRIASKRGARKVAIVTSRVVLPTLDDLIERWGTLLWGDLEVVPIVPENRFFGGNIFLGELMTGGDIAEAISELHARDPDFDLVLVPSPAFGPGGWWRDLAGEPFSRLKRRSKIPVELLICSPFE